MLVKVPAKYIDYIYFSAHYLNCPTHMLNHDLDCFYRQAKGLNNGMEIQWIAEYLKKYEVPKPLETAKEFVAFRETITTQEFAVLNVNSYVDNTPPHIEKRHKFLNDWYEKHTHRYPAIYGGGVKGVDSFPFRTS